jgi:hypothetical protein
VDMDDAKLIFYEELRSKAKIGPMIKLANLAVNCVIIYFYSLISSLGFSFWRWIRGFHKSKSHLWWHLRLPDHALDISLCIPIIAM